MQCLLKGTLFFQFARSKCWINVLLKLRYECLSDGVVCQPHPGKDIGVCFPAAEDLNREKLQRLLF